MSRIGHGYTTPDATDPRMSNPDVLALCSIQDMGVLLYMRFESWHQAMGFHAKDAFIDQSTGIRKSLKTMFQPSKPYLLELWFVVTFKATDFRKYCLRYFSYSLEQKVHTLSHSREINVDCFTDKLVVPPPKILANMEHRRMLLRMPAATSQECLPETKVSRSQHIGAAQDTVAGEGDMSGPAGYFTVELCLAAQQLEDSTPTEAQEARISDHSISSAEILQVQHMQC